MAIKSYRQAINEALAQEMRRDPRVIVMGEDNAGGIGAPGEDDAWGGVLGVTKGLMPEFGRERVLDTPISESAFIGAAAGAAATGLRPVADPRTTSPLDEDTILECVEETGRLVVVDEANPRCSLATDIAAMVAELED